MKRGTVGCPRLNVCFMFIHFASVIRLPKRKRVFFMEDGYFSYEFTLQGMWCVCIGPQLETRNTEYIESTKCGLIVQIHNRHTDRKERYLDTWLYSSDCNPGSALLQRSKFCLIYNTDCILVWMKLTARLLSCFQKLGLLSWDSQEYWSA
jgi:hypothetical protein